MFRASSFCSRAAHVHPISSRPWGRGRETQREHSRLRWRHAVVSARSSQRRDVHRPSTRKLHHWCRSADVLSANRLKLNTEKTELLWAGTKHSQSSVTVCSPFLQLGADTVTAQDDVRLLGVTISSDLSLQSHVSNVSATSFYWLRQLRRVRRSLDSESVATLVHAFVTSRVDQCNGILAEATKSVTDTLQRVMNAATHTC